MKQSDFWAQIYATSRYHGDAHDKAVANANEAVKLNTECFKN